MRRSLEADKPYLGFCLGHQLLADALGVETNNNFYVKGIREVAQSPSESSVELINLLFGEDSAAFLTKLVEISSASQPDLIKMYTGKKKFQNFGVWQTSFTAGGKKVELVYGTEVFVANVKTEETAKLVDYYFDNKNRFEKQYRTLIKSLQRTGRSSAVLRARLLASR